MHDTLWRLHRPHHGSGTTIEHFRLNEVGSQIAFAGRRGRVYRRIVSLAGVRPGDSVLDVGSSSGYLARKLAAAVGPAGQVTGVDPSQAATAYARRRASGIMTFTVGVAQDLDLADSSFDVVTCTLALHHVPARQRLAAFREMYRVTKPGGRLLAADFDPSRPPLPLHPRGGRMRRAAATVGPLEETAAAAGYQIGSTGELPLLRYVLAVRPASQPVLPRRAEAAETGDVAPSGVRSGSAVPREHGRGPLRWPGRFHLLRHQCGTGTAIVQSLYRGNSNRRRGASARAVEGPGRLDLGALRWSGRGLKRVADAERLESAEVPVKRP